MPTKGNKTKTKKQSSLGRDLLKDKYATKKAKINDVKIAHNRHDDTELKRNYSKSPSS